MLRRLLIGCGVLVVVVLFVLGMAWLFGGQAYDRLMNRVTLDPEAPVPTQADKALHESLFIADLHADTLKWERDLLERSEWGRVDLPRLVEGNVSLQSFTIVTRSPLPYVTAARYQGERCVDAASIDMAALLAATQGRPVFSAQQRAIHQIERLKDAIERSQHRAGPELRLIRNVEDLRRLMADRQDGEQVVGAILGIEGGHWVGNAEGDRQAVEADMQQLFDLGVRQFAPTHRFDNALSGSSEGCERYGLTETGKRALQVAERLGIAVDLAHISPQGMADAARLLSEPFMVSHTGVKAVCEPPCRPARNLSDQQIEYVLESGGIIGIGYWPHAVGPSVWNIADAMAHVMQVADRLGLQPGRHVALGSDYDGSVTPFFDVSNLDVLTAVMRQRPQPFDERTIRNIAGLNACRFFARVLPGGSEQAAEEICTPDPLPTAHQ